jgi:acylphosphatase
MEIEQQKPEARLYAAITGRVQGVGFRYFVQEAAVALNLTGWTRNRWDGSVEVTAEGSRENLEKFAQTLQRGSRAAHVSHARLEWETPSGEFTGFRIRMTG